MPQWIFTFSKYRSNILLWLVFLLKTRKRGRWQWSRKTKNIFKLKWCVSISLPCRLFKRTPAPLRFLFLFLLHITWGCRCWVGVLLIVDLSVWLVFCWYWCPKQVCLCLWWCLGSHTNLEGEDTREKIVCVHFCVNLGRVENI